MPGITSARQAYTVAMQVPHLFARLASSCGLRPTICYGLMVTRAMNTI